MDCSQNSPSACTDKGLALKLKVTALAVILSACVLGIGMPLFGRRVSALRPGSNLFFVVKSFAAGVILATAFVHMLPDAFASLTNPCLSEKPWAKFPFAGFISMVAALFTLLIDFWGSAYYQKKHGPQAAHHCSAVESAHPDEKPMDPESVIPMHAHASPHAISPHGHIHPDNIENMQSRGHAVKDMASNRSSDDPISMQIRHRVIAQVLELGIIAHSVIIGITTGASQSPCTIRPLIAALTFHQFFEGMALGGCIAQAGFRSRAAAMMAFFFSVTTPSGIAIGIGIASTYNENSPKALIVQGVFDSMSAGILVYMSLVDLIATDFLSKKLQSSSTLQLYSYVALFLGAGVMSVIALWA